jgi:flagellar biosynthesis/type III secretory pathway M-ring protein FliF/YscJ
VPWKRLFTFVGIYSLIVFGLFAVLKPDQMLRSLPGLVFGALVALMVMALLTKFGWQPTMLKSRAQMAEQRAQQQAERDARKSTRAPSGKAASAGSGGDAEGAPRAKPAPTKRTTPGPTNNPRRTRSTRKR